MNLLKSACILAVASAALFAIYNGSNGGPQVLANPQPKNKHAHVFAMLCERADSSTCARVRLRIWDGDTFIIDLHGAASEKIRVENIDAPEISGKCQSEIDGAYAAKRRLAALLQNKRMSLVRSHLDRYQRQLAVVFADGVDVGAILIAEGLVRKWDGRRHPWC